MLLSRIRTFKNLTTTLKPLQNNRYYKFSNAEAAKNAKFDRNAHFEDPVNEWVDPSKRWLLGGWLLLCAGGVYFMVLLGGYTRLTHSGLSMTKWKPIEYTYPRNQTDWEKEFDYYKQFPEYQHTPIDLDKFKKIFIVEYLHRVSGSTLGAIYVLPLAAFTAMKWIKPQYAKRLGAIGGLGLLQGLIGWWMVKSGLDRPKPEYQQKPRVSTYRLTVHLSMALSLYSLLIWNAATLFKKPQHLQITPENYKTHLKFRGLGIGLIHLVAINLLTGAAMAGIDAGKVFNTWPTMNGQIVPANLFKASPFYKNFFENVVMVQFNHRNAAYLTYAFGSYITYLAYKSNLPKQARYICYALYGVLNYQLLTGVVALLNQVQVHSGSIHQFNALNVLTASLLLCHSVRRPSLPYRNYIKQFV
ncbi:unnamed protein product [Paramecium primaurelia]|uniref:Uncharacterized protein n=1 Tax=Paramecium primaurelia TaxID=5886 RepID=A0A8S1K5E6_PARPR|nr:unnamed protein product [Paramecium primaurelia]